MSEISQADCNCSSAGLCTALLGLELHFCEAPVFVLILIQSSTYMVYKGRGWGEGEEECVLREEFC